MKGFFSSPPKHCSLKESWFLCSYTSYSESSMDLVLKIKQSYKVKTLGGAIVQCGILSLSYKEKKKLSGTKVCNLQTSGTALWLLCMTQGCQVPVFLELGVGGLASAETMHRIGLLNINLITYVLQKTAEKWRDFDLVLFKRWQLRA